MAKRNPKARPNEVPAMPKTRTCGTMPQHEFLLEMHPSYRKKMVQLERDYQARRRSQPTTRTKPYAITVVVHVVHNPSRPDEKISAAQVKSRLADP